MPPLVPAGAAALSLAAVWAELGRVGLGAYPACPGNANGRAPGSALACQSAAVGCASVHRCPEVSSHKAALDFGPSLYSVACPVVEWLCGLVRSSDAMVGSEFCRPSLGSSLVNSNVGPTA